MNEERKWARIEANPAAVASALGIAGFTISASEITLIHRDDRLAASLPGDRIAWFPVNGAGDARLAREARVLRLLARYCDFRAPVVAYEAQGGWQVRLSVPGHCDPVQTYRHAIGDRGFAAVLGQAMGEVLASQHQAIPPGELTGWLPPAPSWPPPKASVMRDLRRVIDDQALIDRATEVIDRFEEEEKRVTDRVLTHSDFGFHNVVVDQLTGRITGVFDYDDAAFADRHHDFKYMLLDSADEVLLEAAIDAYDAAGGKPIDRHRVRLLNAASAVGFLAFRAGQRPDERPAGRTLAEDLGWTRLALDRAKS